VPELIGRQAEREVLDQVVTAIRSGQSRALVVHGEAGVGKTALLDYLSGRAADSGCRVTRVSGVESEMVLSFSALHLLCAPVLDLVDRLPPPQSDALRTVFGLSCGPQPPSFLIGLAVLGLLAEAAGTQSVLCIVDDEQWLDGCSAQILAFVARRLGAESVGLVFAAPQVDPLLAGVADYPVGGLSEREAQQLLGGVLTWPIDTKVRDQLVAESHGNPLALLELPRTDLAGGFGVPGAGTVEESFRRRVEAMPADTRRLLLLAAAEPSGNDALVRRAAQRLGIGPEAVAPAVDAGLAEFATRIRFRHPLVRAAVYRSAPAAERREIHGVLAELTDAKADPDRLAWHRAEAAAGPDEAVAVELEQSAGRARERGGFSAEAAFLRRSTALTVDPAKRATRALAAAQAQLRTGAYDVTADLLAAAEGEQLTDREQAQAHLLRAQLAFVTNRGNDAPASLLAAAKRFESIDVGLARATYLDALSAAIFAGQLGTEGADVAAVARAAAAAPQPLVPSTADLLLDGTALYYGDGYAAGAEKLHQALSKVDAELPLLWMATTTAFRLWDADRWDELSRRYLQLARQTGVLSDLALALTSAAQIAVFAGELADAAQLTAEVHAVNEVTGGKLTPYGQLALAAFRGDRAETLAHVDSTKDDATARGEGSGVAFADWAAAVLANGLGRYQEAVDAAERACEDSSIVLAPSELVEAAVRSGAQDTAERACTALGEMAGATGTPWALGVHARAQALVSSGEQAERFYRDALAQLGKTRFRVEVARTQLLYGEWLRRERRRTDARVALRTAHGMFESMGLAGFAERARRELRAAGGAARQRVVPARSELTAQEAQIARMARDGLSNPEIATRLFISARTVQYHLRKVFTKLEITSRSQLDRVLT
jgi:DNA-binding CsgD family transcriptional regulator